MQDESFVSEECVIPESCDPDLLNEHLARYLYAREFCAAKSVLDTGCGVGYGCHRLAEVARGVVGIDNNSRALRYARTNYSHPGIQYVQGDCRELPFAQGSFDIITSFELLEHISNADHFLAELQRVLKKDGILLISTPNRTVYAEHRAGKPNPFHVREYDPDEFIAFLEQCFPCVRVLGQTHAPAVGIFAIPTEERGVSLMQGALGVETAAYMLCLCSHQPQGASQSMLFIPSAGNVLLERERHIRLLSSEVAEQKAYITQLNSEFDQKAAWADRLNAQLVKSRERIVRLNSEFDQKAAWADRLNAQLVESRERIQAQDAELEAGREQIETLSWLLQRATLWKRRLLYLLAPLDWLTGFLLTFAELIGRLARKLCANTPPVFPPADASKCSIIVVSWEGKHLLAESLPALLAAAKRHGGDNEIIVVDNGSSDGTAEFVSREFPTVRLVQSAQNKFFSGGNNLGARSASRDVIVLLNNDMIVDPDFLGPLLRPFKDSDVFGVASQVFFDKSSAPREETGKTRGYFDGSEMLLAHESIVDSDEKKETLPVFWIGGGAGAFDRRKFLWLGGFDRLYDPFYVEDVDLSYRAWKTGWHCLMAVHSHVLHKHRKSSLRFGKDFVENTTRRNHYLFFWKDVTDLGKTWSHFRHIAGKRVQRAAVLGMGIRFELRAYLRALRKLPSVMRRRVDFIRGSTRSDDEVLEALQRPWGEFIGGSKIDFRNGSFDEYLGGGWHPLERAANGQFRWISNRAVAFLGAPAGGLATFILQGYVPPLERYSAANPALTVRIASKSRVFPLKEGAFECTWYGIKLLSDSVQKIEISVNACMRETTDNRVFGIVVTRLEFAACLDPPVDCDHATETPSADAVGAALSHRVRRILFISAFAPIPDSHAGGQRVLRMIEGLSRSHDVSLLTFYDDDKEKDRLSTVKTYCRSMTAIPRQRSAARHDFLGVTPVWLEREYNSQEMRELVEEAALGRRYDLLQFEYFQTCQFLPRRSLVPMLLTHHEVQAIAIWRRIRRMPGLSRQKSGLAWAWMQMLHYELTRLSRFNQVIVLTEEEGEYLHRYLPHLPVVVHHMGVDCTYFQPSLLEEEPNSLVFVGYFRHEPNIDAAYWLIDRIFPRVLTRFPNARLYLVGNAPPPDLEQHAKGSNVVVTGWVPDVRPFLSRGAVFVAPLRLGAGMRGKVLEAWAMARPVVCSSIACAGARARHEGNLLIADDEDTFVQQIGRLFEDQQLRKRLGQEGFETVRTHYDWELLIRKHNAIYERLWQ